MVASKLTPLPRSTSTEKWYAIDSRQAFQKRNAHLSPQALRGLQQTAVDDGNLFAALMDAAKVCTLGQMSEALYAVGGQYRRNM
jgi:methylmalonyl-CoA mutase